MKNNEKCRGVLVPIFYDYYFFDLLLPITKRLIALGVPVTLMTWDQLVVEKYRDIDHLKIIKAPRVIRSLWNRANRPVFRIGLWIAAWLWVSRIRRSYQCVLLPFDNKPVWYVMSRLMCSVYSHSSTEFIDLDLTLRRERIEETGTWQYRLFRKLEDLLNINLLPRLTGEILNFFPHRLWVDRLMGWRAENHLCGFSGVDLLTVAGHTNKEMYQKAGIEGDKIIVTGSPLYDQLLKIREEFSDREKSRFMSALGIEKKEKLFVFFLSPSAFSKVQINEVESMVAGICDHFTEAQIAIKFHPKTREDYVDIFKERLEKYTQNLVQIHKFSGDVFNAQLVLCADYLVQKQSTVGFIAMKLGTPILSYNLSYTNYEDEMYEIINGSLHIENLEELSRTLPLLFEEGTLREIRARQEVACEKFCLNIDYASDKVAQEIKKLLDDPKKPC